MTTPTPDQITAATAGLTDPIARDRAVQWLHRWQKAVPELFVEPPRKADPPWDVIDDALICLAMNRDGDWGLYGKPVSCGTDVWIVKFGSCRYESADFLKFDRGNMPWDRSIVYRPGHEPGGGA